MRSRDISPTGAGAHVEHRTPANAKAFSQRARRFGGLPDFSDKIGGENGAAPLAAFIPLVVVMRAQEQVLRVDAGPHIALVANEQASGDGAAIGFPRDAMSANISPAGNFDLTVAQTADGADPQEAPRIGLRDRMELKPLGNTLTLGRASLK